MLLDKTLIAWATTSTRAENRSFVHDPGARRHVGSRREIALQLPRKKRGRITRCRSPTGASRASFSSARNLPGRSCSSNRHSASANISSTRELPNLAKINRPGHHGEGLPHLERHHCFAARSFPAGTGEEQARSRRNMIRAIDAVGSASAHPRCGRKYYVHPGLVRSTCRDSPPRSPPRLPKRAATRAPHAALRRAKSAVLQFLQEGCGGG